MLVSRDIQEATSPRRTPGTYVFLARRATTFAVRRQRIPTTNTHTHTPRHICRPPPTVYNWPRRRRRPARRRLLCSSFHRTKPPGGKGQRGNKDFALQKRTPALLIWRRRPLATSLDNRLAVPSRHGPATQQGELQRQRQRPPDC